eukprot:scaffold461_cov321-Pavlova_lutheri.AAC.18
MCGASLYSTTELPTMSGRRSNMSTSCHVRGPAAMMLHAIHGQHWGAGQALQVVSQRTVDKKTNVT